MCLLFVIDAQWLIRSYSEAIDSFRSTPASPRAELKAILYSHLCVAAFRASEARGRGGKHQWRASLAKVLYKHTNHPPLIALVVSITPNTIATSSSSPSLILCGWMTHMEEKMMLFSALGNTLLNLVSVAI